MSLPAVPATGAEASRIAVVARSECVTAGHWYSAAPVPSVGFLVSVAVTSRKEETLGRARSFSVGKSGFSGGWFGPPPPTIGV